MTEEALNKAYGHARKAERLHEQIEEISAGADVSGQLPAIATAARVACLHQFERHAAMACMWAQIAAGEAAAS